MIFYFLKYIRPIWYFNLKPQIDNGYFPTLKQIEESGLQIELDFNYLSKESQLRDLAWTAFQSGFINKQYQPGLKFWEEVKIPIIDEYYFLRKNVHKAWVFYVLIIRIITFHNPITELLCFLKTRKTKRVEYLKQIHQFSDYESFESKLLNSKPFISVVIPTLNRYNYLSDVMKDLENQTYKNFEVIVVDQSEPFQKEFYENWKLNLTYWNQTEKALWKARNEAIRKSKGDLILLYDDDSLIDSNWIEEHIKCLDYFDADLSSGVSISKTGAEIPKHYSYFRWSDQLDTGNVMLKKEIFYTIGFFDLQFEKQRMGDGEFGLRCYLNGYKNISNYRAKRIHLKVSEGGLRQMGSWDGWRPKKMFDPRPIPSVLYLARNYYGSKSAKYYIFSAVLPSLIPYKYKKNRMLKLVSILLVPFLFPLICYQVVKSWKLASLKLKEGQKIHFS